MFANTRNNMAAMYREVQFDWQLLETVEYDWLMIWIWLTVATVCGMWLVIWLNAEWCTMYNNRRLWQSVIDGNNTLHNITHTSCSMIDSRDRRLNVIDRFESSEYAGENFRLKKADYYQDVFFTEAPCNGKIVNATTTIDKAGYSSSKFYFYQVNLSLLE